MAYYVTVTRPTESSANRRWAYAHPTDKRLQLSPFPEPILTYQRAQMALTLALLWFQDEAPGWTVTLEGPDGVMSTHGTTRKLTLDKPAHPNLLTNA